MWDWFNGGVEELEQKMFDAGNKKIVESIGKPIGDALVSLGKEAWGWFIEYLPDIVGYGTMVTGAFIILGAMVGRGGMMKPLSIFAGGLIASICILSSVE